MNLREYNLPDQFFYLKTEPGFHFKLWIPDQDYIVIGQSNKAENVVNKEAVEKDNTVIMKRPSGGETVFLSPKMVIISLAYNPESRIRSKYFFEQINTVIIKALENTGISNLYYKGISDICINDKKILGCSIYRRENHIFYHAVLNLGENISRITQYLAHPEREPDYRQGRSHDEFVTSVFKEGYSVSHEQIISAVRNEFIRNFDEVYEY